MPGDSNELQFVQYDSTDDVATLRLDRPEKKNAVHDPMRTEFVAALDQFAADEANVLVLTGVGDVFCAGSDINALEERLPETTAAAVSMSDYTLPEHIESIDEPVIAMINGAAVGGGLELALACDIRFAAQSATVGFPEITLGGLPGEGGTQRLPRETNLGTALYLILSGKLLDASDARREGIIQDVFEDDALEAETLAVAHSIAEYDQLALILAKQATKFSDRTEFEQGLELEGLFANLIETTPERREHLREFLED